MFASLWDAVVQTAARMGYLGVFAAMMLEGLGLPFPGDAVLALFGYLASIDRLWLPYVVLAATLGSGLGSIVAFALGRRYGMQLLNHYGSWLLISERSIQATERFTRRFGPLVLLFGRLLPGVRTVSSYLAGVGRLSWPVFLVYSFAGFFLFCLGWISLGYLLGAYVEPVLQVIRHYLLGITIAVIIGGAIFLYGRFRRGRS